MSRVTEVMKFSQAEPSSRERLTRSGYECHDKTFMKTLPHPTIASGLHVIATESRITNAGVEPLEQPYYEFEAIFESGLSGVLCSVRLHCVKSETVVAKLEEIERRILSSALVLGI